MKLFNKEPKAIPARKQSYTQFMDASPAAQATALSYQESIENAKMNRVAMELEHKTTMKQIQEQRRRDAVRKCNCASLWQHFLSLAQILVAVAIIIVISTCLTSTKTLPAEEGDSGSVCYATTRPTNICFYGYWAATVSICLSIFISSITACNPSRRSACCMSIESLLGLIGCAWWLACGTVDVIYGDEANNANLPYSECRLVSYILAFVNAGLFLLSFLSSFVSCCTACGKRGDDHIY